MVSSGFLLTQTDRFFIDCILNLGGLWASIVAIIISNRPLNMV